MHYYHDPGSRKRDLSRTIDFCPAGKLCVRSSCRRRRNAQDYAILCRDQAGIVTIESGSCHDFEVCIDSRSADLGVMGINIRAYCVSKQNFVDVAGARIWGQDQPPAQIAEKVQGNVAVEALLTAPDGKTLVSAKSLSIDASGARNAPVPGGSKLCERCSVVGLDPVPLGTLQVHSQVTIQGMGVGLLYLIVVAGAAAG